MKRRTDGTSDLEVAVFTNSNDRPLTKQISLNADGTINTDASACVMAHGRAERVKVAGMEGLATLLG
jgi:hypothetical protein